MIFAAKLCCPFPPLPPHGLALLRRGCCCQVEEAGPGGHADEVRHQLHDQVLEPGTFAHLVRGGRRGGGGQDSAVVRISTLRHGTPLTFFSMRATLSLCFGGRGSRWSRALAQLPVLCGLSGHEAQGGTLGDSRRSCWGSACALTKCALPLQSVSCCQ